MRIRNANTGGYLETSHQFVLRSLLQQYLLPRLQTIRRVAPAMLPTAIPTGPPTTPIAAPTSAPDKAPAAPLAAPPTEPITPPVFLPAFIVVTRLDLQFGHWVYIQKSSLLHVLGG